MNILNLISLVLVLLLAGFFSTQGTFSTLLTLVMALFGSILAMGLGDTAAGVSSSVYEYGQGIGFLGTFVVAFIALRVASDMLIPKNIQLPKWPDKIAAGAAGLLAGLIIVGTLVVGIEMLPLGTSILGNGRFETPDEVKDRLAVGKDINPDPHVVDRTWAGKFATGMYYLTNGGSMGGEQLAAEHPDLGAELTKKRHTVWADMRQTLAPDLIKVPTAFVVTPDDLAKQKIVDVKKAVDSDKLIVVRTEVIKAKSGGKLDVNKPNADTSFDVGDTAYFDVTPAQVRMVTKGRDGKFKEFNPIGFLDHGGKNTPLRRRGYPEFKPLDLATGLLVEDYAESASDFKAIIEWVFEVPDDAEPQFIEEKRGGVAVLTKRDDGSDVIVSDKAYTALAANLYPPREAGSHLCAVTIKLMEDGKPRSGATVWIVAPTVQDRLVSSLLSDAKKVLEAAAEQDSSDAWPSGTAGIPTQSEMRQQYNYGTTNVFNKGSEDPLQWGDVIKIIYYGNAKREPGSMVENLKRVFSGPFSDVMNSGDMAQSRLDKFVTDDNGTHSPPTKLRPGKVCIIVVLPGPKSIKVWVLNPVIDSKNETLTIEVPKDPDFQTTVP